MNNIIYFDKTILFRVSGADRDDENDSNDATLSYFPLYHNILL